MYIRDVGVGSVDNKKSFMLGYLDFDATPIWANNTGTTKITMTTKDNAIGLSFDISNFNMNREVNKQTVQSIGLGHFMAEKYSIFPYKIDYSNSSLNTGLSMPDIEYEEVELTEDAPDNWDIDQYQYYYVLKDDGTANKHYAQVDTTKTWAQIRQSLIDANAKLYKNTDICKWFYVGSGDKWCSFILGRQGGTDSSASADKKCATHNVFTRNIYVSSGYWFTRGYPRKGVNPDAETVINSSQYGSFGFKIGSGIMPSSCSNAMTSGRFTSDTTNPNPICDCSLMQFGIVKYNSKTYFGVWSVSYLPQYYWGYPKLNSSGSWSLTNLDLDNPIDYTDDMEKQEIHFNGICLDDIEVEIDIEDGEPEDDTPPSFLYPTESVDFVGDRSLGIIAPYDAHGFHIYYMNTENFSHLVETLWNWGSYAKQALTEIEEHGLVGAVPAWLNEVWAQQSTNPTNCIVFARKMPKWLIQGTDGVLHPIMIGGHTHYDIKAMTFIREVVKNANEVEFTIGTPSKSYLDYAPYTSITLYLPYIGQIELDPSTCVGGTVRISYVADALSGLCQAQVITYINRNGETREVHYGPYIGDCSTNIPLALNDSTANQRAYSIVKAAVSASFDNSIANKKPEPIMGFGKGAVKRYRHSMAMYDYEKEAVETRGKEQITNAIMDYVLAPKSLGRITSIGNNTASMCEWNPILQITSPAPFQFEETADTLGVTCYRIGKVGDFNGYSEIDWIDFSGLDCTETEEEMLAAILKGGVFL